MKTLNISDSERIVSVAIGSALVAGGISKLKIKSFAAIMKLLAGVYLMRRGADGHCHFNGSLGINTAGMTIGDAVKVYAQLNTVDG